MCANTSKNENRILGFSALLASGFAVGGLVLGLLVGSLVIVFDGVYSLVSLLLTLLSLAVSKYISAPSSNYFPFGKAVLEPVVIAIKGSVILLVVSYSLYSAVVAMFNGGREVDPSLATLFGVINVLGCGYAWWYIARKSKRFSSGLIDAEAKQWQMDTLLSVAVTLGFVVAWLVSLSPFSAYAVYADPIMMIVMSFYFVKVPAQMVIDSLKELLMMRPSKEICSAVDHEILEADRKLEQDIELVGVTKVGRELRINIDVHTNKKHIEIAELERARKSLSKKLAKLSLDVQLTMNIAN
ncbi:cation transporter [Vibrio sonorensis]|uniref:cation transporter n=1 Tax=Vibrio sonorensis TaxID=1004316 RepID=UPI0008D9AD09|nr:cation transporter [Vibrio sonorensis]